MSRSNTQRTCYAQIVRRIGLLLLLVLSSAAIAQTADLSGELRDPSRALIPGATVTVTQTATGVSQQTLTNHSGAYFFSLQPGSYSMDILAKGFSPLHRADIDLVVSQPARLDFTLHVGAQNDTITVDNGTEVLQESTSVGTTITESELERLPINGQNVAGTNNANGRNYTSLILLTPGSSDVSVAGGDGTISGTQLYSVNGQRNQDNNYTLDGVDNNFFHKQSPGLSPPVDSLKEFRVATNNSSSFGRSAGANVALVTKSGTRELHGTVYEYARQALFDANDWFNNHTVPVIQKQPFHYNQYGLTIGGPVYLPKLYDGRKNTFWFFSYDGFRRLETTPKFSNVPTQAQRNGDFSALKQMIYDPQTGVQNPASGVITRTAFPNNTIPTNRLDPVAKAFFSSGLIPLPNANPATTPGGNSNYVNYSPNRNNHDVFVGRADYHLDARNSFFFRYLHQSATQTTPQSLPTYSEQTSFSGVNYAAGWDVVLNAKSLLQLRFGFNNPQGPDITRNTLGIDRSQFFAQSGTQIFSATAPYSVLPSIKAVDFALSETGGTSVDDVFDINAIYSRSIGTALIKLGFFFQPRHYYHDATSPTSGTATYAVTQTNSNGVSSNVATGSGTASFELGYPSSIDRGQGSADVDAVQKVYGGFAVYNRKFGSRLTAEVGLRYEFYLPAADKQDRLGTLWVHNDPASGSVTGTLLWAGVNPATGAGPNQAGFGHALAVTRYENLMPRVGLAYLLRPRWIVRAGYGIYDNSTTFQEVQDERKFYPYNFDQTLTVNAGVQPDTTLASTGPSYTSTSALAGYAQVPDKKTPYSQQYNLAVQSELPGHVVAQVAYVGSTNKHQIGYEPFNTAVVASPQYTQASTVNARRLLPQYGDIFQGANRYKSNYNALQVSAKRRYRNGLEFQANYTWGRSLDNQSSLGEIKAQDPFNPRPDYSRSSFDLTHIVTASFVYDLPFGRGRYFGTRWPRALDAFAGGWAIESINRYETGPPVNVTLGGLDVANTGYVGQTAQRPNVSGDPNTGPKRPSQWFNKAAFSIPMAGTYGNSHAFIVQTDDIRRTDLSVYKRFLTFDRQTLDVRADVFNLPNTVSFGNPKTNAESTSSFGTITTAAVSARQIQLALRYSF